MKRDYGKEVMPMGTRDYEHQVVLRDLSGYSVIYLVPL